MVHLSIKYSLQENRANIPLGQREKGRESIEIYYDQYFVF